MAEDKEKPTKHNVTVNGANRQTFVGHRFTLIGAHPQAGKSGKYIGDKPFFVSKDMYPVLEVEMDEPKGQKSMKRVPVLRSDFWELSKQDAKGFVLPE